jgi:hypothetical protein
MDLDMNTTNDGAPTVPTNTDPTTNVEDDTSPPTKVTLRIIYDASDDEFNIIQNHHQLLAQIKKMDKTLTIYPNHLNSKPYTDIKFIPTTENEFNDHFTVHEQNSNRVTVCINIGITKEFSALKYITINNKRHESEFLKFMKENSIIARIDKFDQKPIARVRFFIYINPDIVFRDAFHDSVDSTLQNLDINSTTFDDISNSSMNRRIPTFEVGFGTVSYRNKARRYIFTRVLDLQRRRCNSSRPSLLNRSFITLQTRNLHPAWS